MTQLAAAPTFQCDLCVEVHELPLSIGFSEPDFVSKLLPWEKQSRCQISPDWCIVDEQFFYIRGCLEVPIIGTDNVFSWGAWSTLSIDDFDRTMELWESAERSKEPAYVGSIANTLPSYKETRNVTATVHTRGVGDRPLIKVQDESHLLFNEQQKGMTMERAIELAKFVIHSKNGNPYSHLCER